MQVIKVIEKDTYGTKRMYVKKFMQRRAIALLTGKKTISEADIEALGVLGFEVKFSK